MPEYMLLLHDAETPGKRFSPDEMQAVIQRYSVWMRRLAESGQLLGGQKLTDNDGRVMRKTNDQLAVTDGPYTETKEIIGGFFHIKADDYQHAIQIASNCPHLDYGTLEIREIERTARV
jgi:hypothetical protein